MKYQTFTADRRIQINIASRELILCLKTIKNIKYKIINFCRILFALTDLNEPEKKYRKYLYDVQWEEISTTSVQAKIYWEVIIKQRKVILKTLR